MSAWLKYKEYYKENKKSISILRRRKRIQKNLNKIKNEIRILINSKSAKELCL